MGNNFIMTKQSTQNNSVKQNLHCKGINFNEQGV